MSHRLSGLFELHEDWYAVAMNAATSSHIAASSNSTIAADRLVSLDALRGFDMLMIVALNGIVHGLNEVGEGPIVKFLVGQFQHKKWEGFTFYDLIFPLFVFMVGVSLVFSLDKALERGGARTAIRRIARRSVVLFLLGVFYNGGIAKGWSQIRWMGVLQRIAISYFFASLIYLACGRCAKRVAAVTVLILVGYWALLSFVPLPGAHDVSFEPEKNWANYLDQQFLPGRLYDKTYDPEGLLSSLPSVATCLLGVLAGMLLKNPNVSRPQKATVLLLAGAALVAIGFLWGLQFPVIKKIWTSSYVLVAGGYSLLLLGLFYLVIDVWQCRRGIAPLVWIGSNALIIYLVAGLIDFPGIANRLLGGEIKSWFGVWGETIIGLASLGLIVALAGFIYRRRIFLRV